MLEFKRLTVDEIGETGEAQRVRASVAEWAKGRDRDRRILTVMQIRKERAKKRIKLESVIEADAANQAYGPESVQGCDETAASLKQIANNLFPDIDTILGDESRQAMDAAAKAVIDGDQQKINRTVLNLDMSEARAIYKAFDALMSLRKTMFMREYLEKVAEDPTHRLSLDAPPDPQVKAMEVIRKLFGG